MRIIFMGTPEFAVPSLRVLLEEGHDVCAVITQSDKPKGRGKQLAMPPVKELALAEGIPVHQPVNLKTSEFPALLKSYAPDFLVTAAYGKILTQAVLEVPKYGCINVHASLLPQYRGAAPIQWAIIKGETVTGITTMMTDIGLDTGDILLKEEVPISQDITSKELHDILSDVGASLLARTLHGLLDGSVRRISQEQKHATYAPMLKKEMGEIVWAQAAAAIHNFVRGVNPWPGAYTFYHSERLRIWKTDVIDEKAHGQDPGKILDMQPEGLTVACKDGVLRILEVQADAGKRMAVADYLRGHPMQRGEMLGAAKA